MPNPLPSEEVIEALHGCYQISAIPLEAVERLGMLLMQRVEQCVTVGNEFGQIEMTEDGLRGATQAVIDLSALTNPDVVGKVILNYTNAPDTQMTPHSDIGIDLVMSVLATGTDRFSLYARQERRPDDPDITALPNICAIDTIPRAPGTAVSIDQTVTVTDEEGNAWYLEHGVTDASWGRLSVVYGTVNDNVKPFPRWPTGELSYIHNGSIRPV